MNVQHLKNELQNMHDAMIVQTRESSFPMFSVTLHYYPIQKTPMDILMKMMLIAFQKAPIKAPAVLANILVVEPLFIEDLTEKMMSAQLIERAEDGTYQLTAKGNAQLEAGIFEEQLELVKEEVYYSAIHGNILDGEIDAILEWEELPEPLPYAEEELGSIQEEEVLKTLQERMQALETEEDTPPPLFINAIETFNVGTIHDIPFTVFILKENKSDRLFTRIFNYYTNQWDAQLEQFVTENERMTWNDLL